MLQESVLEQLAQRATQYSVNLNGRVRRDQLCSRGGYGVVWRGTLSPQGVQVAVKTVGSDYVSPEDTETIKAAVREVHTWSKLSHVNVIRLLGITTEFNNTISFVSEWTENGNAHNYVQDVTVDPRPLLDGIASGLAYLHNHKPTAIFHGDLKGANVLISPEGHPLLTDFGLSCVVESSLNISVASCHGGSLRWMAPENLDTGNITAAGDVWAFGMTALELFTRKVPFHDRHGFPAIMCAITRERPERPSEVETLGRMTDDWWDICWSCWNTDPLARPPMTSIVCDISYVFANLHASLSPTIRPRHVQPAPTIPNNVVLPMTMSTTPMNVIIAGESGVGKSSLINLILGQRLAATSDDPSPCTTASVPYKTSIDGREVVLWDTPGINDGQFSRLGRLLLQRGLGYQGAVDLNVDLLLYCLPAARAKVALMHNYNAMCSLVHPSTPVVAIVTRLERYEPQMEEWWIKNEPELTRLGMSFVDHACITALSDCDTFAPYIRERIANSRDVLLTVIREALLSEVTL